MNIEGPVLDVGDRLTVSTASGDRDLAEIEVRTDDGPRTVTLWGRWTETADRLDPGMTLRATALETEEFRGETRYATTGDSFVVVEPDFLVDVTDVRAWVQCPRMYYLNKIGGVPLEYPVVKGTIVHEVFGDLLRGRDLDAAVEERVAEAGLELGLLERDADEVREDVRQNARAIDGWLSQGTLTEEDDWRSEQTLISETFGLKGRADAVRRGMPVELKTGKNLQRDPRFEDKIQAAAYALLLREGDDALAADTHSADTGVLLYTKNAALDRTEFSGDFSPAKEFSIGHGLLAYVVQARNGIAAMEHDRSVPTGYEADAVCEYCFEQDVCKVVAGRLDQESKAGSVGAAVPAEERAYFERVYRAIERERRATHREYAKLWKQTAAERADDDRALVDLSFRDARELSGGRWELRAERPGGAVSKIREGDLVLASDGHPVRGAAELARVERLGEDELVLTADEPLEVSRIDVYPSELSVDRMLTALHEAVLKGDQRRKDLLFGRATPEFGPPATSVGGERTGTAGDDTDADADANTNADTDVDADPAPATGEANGSAAGNGEDAFIDNNDAQDRAVRMAIGCEDCALIHGPPGTGKTYTIARAVRALVERGERVLLSAFTNRAVDNVLDALLDQGFEAFVRYGTESGVRDDLEPWRLEQAGDPEERAAELRGASVVAATTASCGSRALRELEFDVAIVDEAAQLTEPGTLAAIERADRFVLVGDHQQLPPVVRSDDATADGGKSGVAAGENDPGAATDGAGPPRVDDGTADERTADAADEGAGERAANVDEESERTADADGVASDRPGGDLSRSLFERLIETHPEASVLLDRQYRMAQRIQAFSSREFYDGQVRPANGAVAGRSLADLDGVDPERLPADLQGQVTMRDVPGDQRGNVDPAEAAAAAEVVDAYLDAGLAPDRIGVIAPFRAQVAEIDGRVPGGVTVDTVDRFQGSAKEAIVVSFVASGDLESPIFEDYRRVNVALTRAKRALTLVGDADALRTDDVYARMVDWADR